MYYYEDELSPTDTSEDSIEISVKPIHKKFTKNKRKSVEPRRVKIQKFDDDSGSEKSAPDYNENELKRKYPVSHLAPKKRFKLDALLEMERQKIKEEITEAETSSLVTPFRPWAEPDDRIPSPPPVLRQPNLPLLLSYALRAQAMVPEQDEPLSLVVHKKSDSDCGQQVFKSNPVKEENLNSSDSDLSFCSSSGRSAGRSSTKKQTNYKSITTERRVEANARERQRVHTITAAFDTLQEAIPTHEENIRSHKIHHNFNQF